MKTPMQELLEWAFVIAFSLAFFGYLTYKMIKDDRS